MPDKTKRPFSKKHDLGLQPDPVIEKALTKQAENMEISCAQAFEIAQALNVPPKEVGRTADLMEISLMKCQMGIFGYKPENKIIKAENTTNQLLVDALAGSMENNRLSCQNAWQIARRFNISKLKVCNISQANGIQIGGCQLGAF